MTNIQEIKNLSIAEKIVLVEELWDEIAEHPEEIALTDAIKAELDRRLENHRRNPSEGHSWEEVRERIRQLK